MTVQTQIPFLNFHLSASYKMYIYESPQYKTEYIWEQLTTCQNNPAENNLQRVRMALLGTTLVMD